MKVHGELAGARAAALVILLAAAGCGPSTASSVVNANGGAGVGASGGGGSGGATAGLGGAGAGGATAGSTGADAGVADAGIDAPSLAPDAPEDVPLEHSVYAPTDHVADASAESRDATASNSDAAGADGDAGGDAAVMHPRYLDSLSIDENFFSTWVAFGADGSTYLVGSYDKRTDFDPTIPGRDYRDIVGTWDVFVTKLNPDGSRAWTKTIGGQPSATIDAEAIAVTSDSIFVTGQFAGTIDFDPGAGTASRTGTQTTAFVLRLTTEGAFGWVGVIPSVNAGDACWVSHELVAGSDGSLYTTLSVTGTCDVDPGPGINLQATTDPRRGVLLKLSQTDGHLIWLQAPQGAATSCGVSAATIALDGNVWTAVTGIGCTFGPADTGIDNGTIYASLTPAGAIRGAWLVSGDVSPYALAAATDGDVYAAGAFTGTVDFDPGTAVANRTAMDGGSGYMLKLAADGTYRWVRTLPARSSYAFIAATPNGGAIGLGSVATTQGLLGFHVDAFDADSTPAWTFPLMNQGVSAVAVAAAPTQFAVSGNSNTLLDLDPGPGLHNAAANSVFVAFYGY